MGKVFWITPQKAVGTVKRFLRSELNGKVPSKELYNGVWRMLQIEQEVVTGTGAKICKSEKLGYFLYSYAEDNSDVTMFFGKDTREPTEKDWANGHF